MFIELQQLPHPGDIVRDRFGGATLGHVVDIYFLYGEYQVAIDPLPGGVARDYIHYRACDVDVEARCG